MRVDLLILRNRVFMVRNAEIWAVLSSNGSDLLMLNNRVFSLRNVEKCAVPSRKGFDLLMLRNRVIRLRNVQIRAVRSYNRVDLLMLRNRVFRLRNFQKCAVTSRKGLICWCSGIAHTGCETFLICSLPSWKVFDMLILRNRVLSFGIVHMWVVPPCYVVDLLMFRNCVLNLKNFRYVLCRIARGSICELSGMVFSGCEMYK